MASLRALQTYGKPVLLRLVDGSQPQHLLGVPPYALDALREVGLVKRRMVRSGAVAEAHWFLADEEGPQPAKSCDSLGLFDGIPEDGAPDG